MAQLLRSWLWPGIENELRKGLGWQNGSPSPRKPNSGLTYVDDGTMFRVTSRQLKSPLVQIIKFLTYSTPIKALISDGTTYIQATIASSAVDDFAKTQKRRVTDGTQGGLIQLLRYEIVVTHLPEELTLYIEKFLLVGSDGEGTFGKPQSIFARESVKTLIGELGDFRRNETMNRSKSVGPHQDARETFNDAKAEEQNCGFQEFATQDPGHLGNAKIPQASLRRLNIGAPRGVKRLNNETDAEEVPRPGSFSKVSSSQVKRQCLDKAPDSVKSSIAERHINIQSQNRKNQGANTNAALLGLLSKKNKPNLHEDVGGRPRSLGNLLDELAPPNIVSHTIERNDSCSVIGVLPVTATPMAYQARKSPDGTKQTGDGQPRSKTVSPKDSKSLVRLEGRDGQGVSSSLGRTRGSSENLDDFEKTVSNRTGNNGDLRKGTNTVVIKDPLSADATRTIKGKISPNTGQANESETSRTYEERIEYEGSSSARFARRGGASVLLSREAPLGERKRTKEVHLGITKPDHSESLRLSKERKDEGSGSGISAQGNVGSALAPGEKSLSEWEQAEDPWHAVHSYKDQSSNEQTVALTKMPPIGLRQVEDPWQSEETKMRWLDNQERLVNHPDTWIPPEGGNRIATSIPLSVLKALPDLVENPRQPPQPGDQIQNGGKEVFSATMQEAPSQKSNHENASVEDNDNESVAGPEDWPSSAVSVKKANRLPPDSDDESLASLQLDSSKHTALKQPPREEQAEAKETRTSSLSGSVKSDAEGVTLFDGQTRSRASASPTPVSSPPGSSKIGLGTSDEPTLAVGEHCLAAGAVHEKRGSSMAHAGKDGIDDRYRHTSSEQPDSRSQHVMGKSAGAQVDLETDNDNSSQSEIELAAPNALPDYVAPRDIKAMHQTPSGSSENRTGSHLVDRTPYNTGSFLSNGKPSSAELEGSSVIVPGTFNQHGPKSQAPMTASDANRRGSGPTQDNEYAALATELRGKIIELKALHPPAHPEALLPQVNDLNQVTEPAPKRRKYTIPTSPSHGGTYDEDLSLLRKPSKLASPTLGGDESISKDFSTHPKITKFISPFLDEDNSHSRDPPVLQKRKKIADPILREDGTSCGNVSTEYSLEKLANLVPGEDRLCREDTSRLPEQTKLASPILGEYEPRPEDPSHRMRLERRAYFEKCRAEDRALAKSLHQSSSNAYSRATSPLTDHPLRSNGNDRLRGNTSTSSPQVQVHLPLFQAFQEAYPDYKGDDKHFNGMCQWLRTMISENRMIHKSMWDDFIIRHRQEYCEYSSRCNEGGECPMPYEAYYCMEIDEPLYSKRIVSPTSLSTGVPIKSQSPKVAVGNTCEAENAIECTITSTNMEYVKEHGRVSSQALSTLGLNKEFSREVQISEPMTAALLDRRSSTKSPMPERSVAKMRNTLDISFPSARGIRQPEAEKTSTSAVGTTNTSEHRSASTRAPLAASSETEAPEGMQVSKPTTVPVLIPSASVELRKKQSIHRIQRNPDDSMRPNPEADQSNNSKSTRTLKDARNMDQKYSPSAGALSSTTTEKAPAKEQNASGPTTASLAPPSSSMESRKRRSLPWAPKNPSSSFPSSPAARQPGTAKIPVTSSPPTGSFTNLGLSASSSSALMKSKPSLAARNIAPISSATSSAENNRLGETGRRESNVIISASGIRVLPPTQEQKDLFKSLFCN